MTTRNVTGQDVTQRLSSAKERETKSGSRFVVNMNLNFWSQESLENQEDFGGRAQNLRRFTRP
jgi:deferrochelatase/peroxidase EfeB